MQNSEQHVSDEWRRKMIVGSSSFLLRFWQAKQAVLLKKHYSVAALAELTMMQMSRPGWPISFISPQKHRDLFPQISQLSDILYTSPSAQAIQEFADSVAHLLVANIPEVVITEVNYSENEAIERNIKFFLEAGCSPEQAVLRASAGISKAALKLKSKNSDTKMTQKTIKTVMAKMLHRSNAPEQSALGRILNDNVLLSGPETLKALGNELYTLCQPMGFSDDKRQVLIMKVASAASAYNARFRTGEILSRLKRLKGFENLREVRFQMVF